MLHMVIITGSWQQQSKASMQASSEATSSRALVAANGGTTDLAFGLCTADVGLFLSLLRLVADVEELPVRLYVHKAKCHRTAHTSVFCASSRKN